MKFDLPIIEELGIIIVLEYASSSTGIMVTSSLSPFIPMLDLLPDGLISSRGSIFNLSEILKTYFLIILIKECFEYLKDEYNIILLKPFVKQPKFILQIFFIW